MNQVPDDKKHDDQKNVAEEIRKAALWARHPLLNPFHPFNEPVEKQVRKIRDALCTLSETTPLVFCGGPNHDEGAWQKALKALATDINNTLLSNWTPNDDDADRLEKFDNNEVAAALADLTGDNKLKGIPLGGKPAAPLTVRKANLLSRLMPDGQTKVKKPATIKKFVVHLRSTHPNVTIQVVKEAFRQWLELLWADLEVLDERALNPQPAEVQSTAAVDHVYIIDDKALAHPALATFPNSEANIKAPRIWIRKHPSPPALDIGGYGTNVPGVLLHEVGHLLGFMHEHRGAAGTGDPTVEHGTATALDQGTGSAPLATGVVRDEDSVMLYAKLYEDTRRRTVTRLSVRDVKGCRNLYSMKPSKVTIIGFSK